VLVTFETAKKGKSRKSEYEAEGREEPAPHGGGKSNLREMAAAGRGCDGVGEDPETQVVFFIGPRWGFGGKQDGAAAQLDFLGFLPLRAS